MIEVHAYTVPVHTKASPEQRALGAGLTVVSCQTVVAADPKKACVIAQDTIRKFVGNPGLQTWAFPSEVTVIEPKVAWE